MEPYDAFTLRNRAMQGWLFFLLLAAGALATITSPAFWMALVGVLLAATGVLAYSARSEQGYSWRHGDRPISWFEGWALLSGTVIGAAPFIEIFVRAYLGL